MARHGENIYKRKDGRYEGRYVTGKKANGATRFGCIWYALYGCKDEAAGKEGRVSQTRTYADGLPWGNGRKLDAVLDGNRFAWHHKAFLLSNLSEPAEPAYPALPGKDENHGGDPHDCLFVSGMPA